MFAFLIPILAGLASGAGLIVAIGPQNVYLLRQGIRRSHVAAIVTICVVSDIVLLVAGVSGLGAVVTAFPSAITVAKLLGGTYVCVLGLAAARRALRPLQMPAEAIGADAAVSRGAAITTALALTWLNPHVYLDTVLTLGGLANTHGPHGKWLFAAGAGVASILWFSGLGWGATKLAPAFGRAQTWRIFDTLVALVMLTVGVALLSSIAAVRGFVGA